MSNWAYLLRCADGTYYAGWTNDLEKRLAAHNAGTGAKYTRGRGPVQLAWARCFATKSEAMAQEVALKRLPRAEKQRLAEEYLKGATEGGVEVAGGAGENEPH